MDSSLKNPSYDLWKPPSAPRLLPLLAPPIPHQFHSEWLNCYDRSRQIDRHHHQDFHNYMHRQDLAVNEPPSYYFQPSPILHVSYEPPWISQPAYNFSCTEPRDFSQSAWIGYMERRFDAGSDHNYQLDYGHRARDCSNGGFNRDWNCNFGSRDGFGSLGYTRNEFGDARIEENYRYCGQFNSESDGYCRSLRSGTSFSYGNFLYGATLHRDIIRNSASNGGTENQRWVEKPKDDYYHSEIERRFYNGKRKGSDEPNRTTKKPRQEESLLLQIETPRPHQKGRENDRSRRPANFSEKRFVEKKTVGGKGTSCTAGKVLLLEVTKKKDLSRCSEGGVPFAGKSMSSLRSQPCEDEITQKNMDDLSSRNLQMEEVNHNNFIVETNTTTSVDSLDRTVASQAESKNSSQNQACENGVNSSVEIVSRKETMETTPLNSTAEVDNNLESDAGKCTCTNSISSSPKKVTGKGSSNAQPEERTSVLSPSICKNQEGWSSGSILDRELSSAMCLEDVSFAPNEDLGLSSHDPAEISYVDQSCDLSCRGMKTCSTESNVSLIRDKNVGASEFHLKQEVREKAPTCDKFSSSPVSEIENSVTGYIGSSGSKMVTGSETQPSLEGCKFLPNDHFGCGASDVVASFWMSSVDKDLVDDPLRISSRLVTDSSVSPCHHSPSVSVNEQIQNSASSGDANCSSHCGIIEKEMGRAENMDGDDIQEEKVKITRETSQYGTSGTDFVTVSGDSIFQCGSSSSLPKLNTRQIQNETHAAAKDDKTNNSKECNKEEILLDVSEEQIENLTDGVLVDKPDGELIEKLNDVPSDFGSQEISLANTDTYIGEALSFGDKVTGTETPSNSDVLLSKLHSHADAVAHAKDYVVSVPHPDSGSKTTLSSISKKTEKRENKFMNASQKSYPRSRYDTKKDANPPINVTKHHTWHRNSNTSVSPLVAVKPKVTVQSTSTYIREGNSLLRKPSPGSLGKAQTLQRHSSPPSDSTSSGKRALSPSMDPLSNYDPDFVRNGLKSCDTLIHTGYASNCQPKQNPPKLESSNPIKMLYVKRKANQLVAASDIHGASNSKIPPSSVYFKRSKNQISRNSERLANQGKSLPDATLDSHTAVVRPFNHSKCSLVRTLREPLSRKANRVHISHPKIVQQPVPWKRVTCWRRSMNPTSVLRNGSFSTISRKLLMMRKRDTVYRISTNGYSPKKSKVLSIGGSHLKWSKSIERDLKKPEFRSDESSCSGPPESGKDTKKSSIPKRMAIGNDKYVWIRNGNQLVRDPKKRSCVLANEKVRWILHNARLRRAKRRNYCQFFTRFGKCNKDDGKCRYIHDPSKIAVCTKFLSGSCANLDCKLTHKVIPESMPDCYYFLQGLCNNEACPYRHVHVHQNAAICEGFLRGYCSDGNKCRKKHTYTCQVFEATGCCLEGSECKLHHPKNRSKGKKRKRASEPWQEKARGHYFGCLPESEPMLVNELAIDGAEEGPDFIRLDVNKKEARKKMDSSARESVSDENLTDELIRPVCLMQKYASVPRVQR